MARKTKSVVEDRTEPASDGGAFFDGAAAGLAGPALVAEALSVSPHGRRPFFRRRKTIPFAGSEAPKIDYKDVKLLQRYVSERGKIAPSRITAVSTRKQRELARALKRAKFLGLLSYVIR